MTEKLSGIWECKIGWANQSILPPGADFPMRAAIEAAFVALTGHQPQFIFSGWNAELDEIETQIAEGCRGNPLASVYVAGVFPPRGGDA